MNDTVTGKPSIGDEIPYRRDRIEKKTGSLVFDNHLNEAAGDGHAKPANDHTKDRSDTAH